MAFDKELFGSLLTVVDSTASEKVGTIRGDEFGNKYIYLQGVASVALGSVVTYIITSRTGSTTVLATTGSKGPIAVAMAAVVALKFGWFQIEGFSEEVLAISGGDAAVSGRVFLTGTAGSIDDVAVLGNEIVGMIFTVQEGETTLGAAYAGVYMNAPRTAYLDPQPILTQLDATALHNVGTRFTDDEGNVYVYLTGATNCTLGSWVTYYITSVAGSVTAEIAANAIGLVGVAMAAIIETKFGWFQIAGNNLSAQATSGGDAAAGAIVYYQAAGIVDDQVSAGNMIHAAVFSVQEGEVAGGAGFAGVTFSYPFMTDEST